MKKNATIIFLESLSLMEIAHYPVHQTYNAILTATSVLGLCNRDACKNPPSTPKNPTPTDYNLTAEFSVLMVLYHWHMLGTNLTEKQILQFFFQKCRSLRFSFIEHRLLYP